MLQRFAVSSSSGLQGVNCQLRRMLNGEWELLNINDNYDNEVKYILLRCSQPLLSKDCRVENAPSIRDVIGA